MKQGRAPLVVSGAYASQPYEVDHIIPVAEHPALGRELANLIYLPRTVNRRKSADIQQRTLDLAQKLTAASVLTQKESAQLHETRQQGSARDDTPRKVNLNKASAKAIESLPGIGPATAAAIIAARTIKDLAALDQVPGLGPKTLEALRELVSF